ncbi:hypothetical protein GGR51DRAFT_552456 [Nemania sp. FL0031]|nr:hypothetical protein GGR51DRAFT_552456 [Nemania sp. FL0031]
MTHFAKSPEDLLSRSCEAEWKQCKRVVKSGFKRTGGYTDYVLPSANGFVYAAYMAYNEHHHLTIRPEDVWFAILTQLSTYINANTEELRSHFVSHDGKQDLHLIMPQSAPFDEVDFGLLSLLIAETIEERIVDPELRQWMMPEFTTTTENDKIVAAILMMGSMQKYFSFSGGLCCGIPSVTLLGEMRDWIEIRERLDRQLHKLGKQPEQFAILLRPILDYFIRSFEDPNNEKVIDFWSKIAAETSNSSGPDYLSGWITAFCFWDDQGRQLGYGLGCDIEGVEYPSVNIAYIPPAYASVPVEIIGAGREDHKIKMAAGLVGIGAFGYGSCLNSVRPVSGWWAYEVEDENSVDKGRANSQ